LPSLPAGLAPAAAFEVFVAFEASRSRPTGVVPPPDEVTPMSAPRSLILTFSIDAIADAALSRERDAAGRSDLRCDACDEKIEGEPAGRGLFLSTRGEEVRYHEPGLCARCATAIGLRANLESEIEEEEG